MIELTELDVLKNLSNWRESFHATYNGGHHDDGNRAAFHHGMDTVFNAIDARIKELEKQAKTPPDATPADGKQVELIYVTEPVAKIRITLSIDMARAMLNNMKNWYGEGWKSFREELKSAVAALLKENT